MRTGHRKITRRTIFVSTCLAAVVAFGVAADRTNAADRNDAESTDIEFKVVRGAEVFGPFVPTVVNVDTRQLPAAPQWRPGDPIKEIPKRDNRSGAYVSPDVDMTRPTVDPLLERQQRASAPDTPRAFTTPELNFPGQGFNGVQPPDPSGDVGGDWYIQVINAGGGARVQIYNKADGTTTGSAFQMDSLGSGFCGSGLGDGVVLYDEMADRWLLTEFSSSGSRICLYVSQTPNPVTGGWFAYEINAPSFPDYPKYGVWPDAYYVSSNEGSPAAYAIDRTQMLAGLPATVQRFSTSRLSGFGFQALNPTDHDGSTLAPSGSPNWFMRHRDDEVHGGSPSSATNDWLELFEFSVDFAVPANSSFSGPIAVPIAEIDSTLCGLTSFSCFQQPGTGTRLDPLREVVMFPIGYRNFGTHQSIVANLVTDVAVDRGGIRWFELRRTGTGPWSLFQEGTYAPDTDSRFMGSAKQDGDGNLAVGYVVSSSSTFPSLRYHGRLAGDPVGTLPGSETVLTTGSGSNSSNRYGDYSQMGVDPEDDCTFWYTMEWNPSSSWATQIGAFKFDECGEPGFTLNGDNLDQSVCAGDDLTDIPLTVGQVQSFSNPVTLSYSGLSPLTGGFTTNPVTPPGSSTAQVSVGGGVAAGNYSFDIVGNASGADPRQLTVTVDVSDSLPAAPGLFSPPNGAANITNPNYSWAAVAQASSYLVEVATDAGFSNIVDSASVSGTSYAGAGLAPDTQHFWRVTASNPCGTGATSATFSFTTSLTICRTPGAPISDNSTTSDTLSVATSGTLDDLNVSVDLTHSFVGDLIVNLTHVDTGTVVRLFNRTCGTGNDFDITFDDEAASTAASNCSTGTPAIPPGSYQPDQPLSAFDGEAFSGDWTLSVSDNAGADTGSLSEWCVTPGLSGSCGDGIVDPGEQCDDGNTASGDGCDSNCVTEMCGNGVVQAGEECDDGNTVSNDGCSATCVVEFCGDGIVHPGEECDDGNTANSDGCDSNCVLETCGNGVVQAGEECDDGNTVSNDGCSATCVVEFCGDGIVHPGEECDDGNTANGDGCDSSCLLEICGNGIVQAGEECDDGNAVDDDACANDCTANFDPNLLVNGDFSDGEPPWIFFTNGGGNFDVVGGEARVDFTADGSNVQLYQRNIATAGNTEHTLSFRARHTAPNQKIQVRFAMHESPFTFYGLTSSVTLSTTMQTYSFDFTTPNEVITDGRLMFLLPRADGVGETFFVDDVVLRLTTPDSCGNGSLDAGESCDGANLGGESCSTQGFDGGTLACNATCDGFVTSSCFVCGDNTINGTEICDGSDLGGESCSTQGFDGGALACSPTCDLYDTSGCTICGDGTVDPGEQCDDGNTTSGDGCSSECVLEGCGNGVVDPGEQCDDGNVNDGDGCDSACVLESCGNGIVQSGEQCDDGNTTNGDGCDSNCIDEVCGNGIVQSGEQCDDGNTNDNDACSNSCTINATTNVVDNGDFSGGESPWIFWDNRSGGTFDVVSGEGKVTFGGNSTNVQLYQRGIDADGSTDYTLTFRARHTGSPKRVTVRFALHTSPYTFYGLSQNVNLTSTMQTYSVDFTTTNNVITDGRLMFLLSDSDTPTGSMFVVDDVVLAPSSPSTCGNGSLDPGETCDGANLDGESCITQGFDGGTLSCNATCDGFVTSACTGCGNGVVDPGETCDGSNLDGESCVTQGFDGGTLSCNATCDSFVTSSCSVCGDGTVDPGEQCDDGNTTNGDGCSSSCQTEGGGTNLVTNGNFSGGTSGWSYSSDGNSSFSVTGGEAFINMITPGTNTQLYQPNLVLQPNTTYQLTFRGRNTGGDNVRVRVIRHTSPYNNYGLDQVINLTTTMQTFSLTFTTPGGTLAPARLMMWMAPYDSAGDDYFFDDFVLTEQ